MLKLTAIFFIVIAPTLAGIFALVPLTMYGTLDFDPMLFIAFVVAGVVLALPVSWYVAKRVDAAISKERPAATA
ncbi:hypothetical protein SAMN04515647_4543 [Cohaesibacter sp. ES.047]|uniref:hypothetical protein n=1 Tax=Cohaesibacter sp. ES.047 TaxID=1798205 RepID=UPI000BB6F90C|nr:hypothetical protein [Cohaesibacter sp. ES.047]SNY94218.1 hypothetical protein SAMN04515647_4543 [Cohaesibacter sp. ES.047]